MFALHTNNPLANTSLLQAVSDNSDAMKALMVQLVERVRDMSEASKDAKSDEAQERIDGFIKYGLPNLWSICD